MNFLWSCYLSSQLKIRSCLFWNSCGGGHRRAKFFLPPRPAAFQGLLNRVNKRFTDCSRIAKTHFTFCRVNVYIDRRGIDFEKEERYRILAFHQSGVITLAECSREKRAFNGAAIYKDKLLRPCLPAQSCLADKSSCANISRRCAVYLNKALQ